jgi:putative endonuclease
LNTTSTAYQRGLRAEQIALDYLSRQGLKELERNYRTRSGEIDLIMLDNHVVVFIEVRARTNAGYINPIETIDGKKIHKIILASRQYLQQRHNARELYRFDIVILTGNIHDPEINWVKNAFFDE